MKVRCIRLLESSGKPTDKSGWLTIGKTYHVLEVMQDRGRWLLRLIGDEPNGLALFQLEQFEIVSSKIPSSWIISWGKEGFFELTTEAWRDAGFWDRYYDRDPEALRIFEDESKNIIEGES
jgi:hypothetical protein